MSKWLSVVVCVVLVVLPLVGQSQGPGGMNREGSPGLLVTKTRVVLEGKKRSDAITLSNNGSAAGVYKIELINRRMNEDGSVVDVQEPMEGELFAKRIIRISPRRVTLQAGSSQNIRILARKSKDLAAGEYRSHLLITADPVDKQAPKIDDNTNQKTKEQFALQLRASFGVVMPVIVRHGKLDYEATISDVALVNDKDGKQSISFVINRSGLKSTYGDIKVVYTNTKGKEIVVKSLGGFAVYTPNKKRMITLPLDIPKGVSLSGGTLQVSYIEKEKDGGQIIAQSMLTL